jgi:hypothetical protein
MPTKIQLPKAAPDVVVQDLEKNYKAARDRLLKAKEEMEQAERDEWAAHSAYQSAFVSWDWRQRLRDFVNSLTSTDFVLVCSAENGDTLGIAKRVEKDVFLGVTDRQPVPQKIEISYILSHYQNKNLL